MEKHIFYSENVRCAGVLYRPAHKKNPPVVVMGHGLGAHKEFRLPAFAERFTEKGIAAFLFDYRYHGNSEGKPRELINPWAQLKDWHAAVDYVKLLPDLDSHKLALWGSSFGGGHVLAIAAARNDISCVVSQVPFVSGISSLRTLRVRDLPAALATASADMFKTLLRLKPYYIPLIGRPEEFAVMKTEESYEGYSSIISPNARWSNRCPARVLFFIFLYSPRSKAKDILCPVLLLGARHDSLIPLQGVRQTAKRLRQGHFEVLDCNHFQAYTGEYFEKAVAMETEFLTSHL